ncbi:gfo/Idh/MocA family oxidoreductase [Actinobacteria bacterium YIM 96077]|uniref:Gfo/Idh/MocA family oxidoreductase n=1 Tax=Phytoactinopolyspora halophila TaxID=1981511 RepID=A0A329QPY5_9ACTN|nr:Gfo/Idh/MocA family oxidoreductase [Phytoactinopolyspora halophila]AYY12293.1 gfo/Idh/MocA family oxidoreductase [Actinobacteria bacterium YIM 96077]RAW13789.1 gfo/Idh/MocA family oxidoreductase [Phytoactinopolyspora halophila]
MANDGIGLAVVGCGTVGRVRAELAREHPAVGWLGMCDIDEDLRDRLAADTGADVATGDFRELVRRPEVSAVVVATDENWHVEPILASVERGHPLFIEKPLATDPVESGRVLRAIEDAGIDAVVGYTQRFRRRFITSRQRIRDGVIGDVTTVVTRAFMNRMVPLATLARTEQRETLTPMVVSGTHSLDACLWLLEGLEGKEPVEVYAKAGDTVLGQYGTKDNTLAIFTLADGSLWNLSISWALPATWPGAVYGLEIGVVGTSGVLDIEDTHRDLVLASEEPQDRSAGYAPKGYDAPLPRYVDFLGSRPFGDDTDEGFWGPMREETMSWFNRLLTGRHTHHATAADGHRNLLITMAMDRSARTGQPVRLPPDPTTVLGD